MTIEVSELIQQKANHTYSYVKSDDYGLITAVIEYDADNNITKKAVINYDNMGAISSYNIYESKTFKVPTDVQNKGVSLSDFAGKTITSDYPTEILFSNGAKASVIYTTYTGSAAGILYTVTLKYPRSTTTLYASSKLDGDGNLQVDLKSSKGALNTSYYFNTPENQLVKIIDIEFLIKEEFTYNPDGTLATHHYTQIGGEDFTETYTYSNDKLSGVSVESSEEYTTTYSAFDAILGAAIKGAGRTFTGTALSDEITGTSRNDIINGGTGFDTIDGGAGNDSITAVGTIDGNAGNDYITATGDHSHVYGGAGDDTLIITDTNTSGDTGIWGGTGNDVIEIALGATFASLDGGSGTDTVITSANFDISSNLTIENLKIKSGITTGIELVGNSGANGLTGGNGNDSLDGRDGADTLVGGAGDDNLDGSAGVDTLVGGAGNDTYIVDDAGDVIDETAIAIVRKKSVVVDAGGTDLVKTYSDYTLGANVENLTAIGFSTVNLTGNAGANVLTGNVGANILKGLGGNDTYHVEAGDTVDETTTVQVKVKVGKRYEYQTKTIDAGGVDTVVTSGTYVLGENLENLSAEGSLNPLNLTGNALNNTITGNANNNIIHGGDGNDYLIGNGGNNKLYGENGNDTLTSTDGFDTLDGGAGNDTFMVNSNTDTIDGGEGTDTVLASEDFNFTNDMSNVENLTANYTLSEGHTRGLILTGNTSANIITGGAGNDTLNNGAGAGIDTLIGGAGNDDYYVNNSDAVIDETKSIYYAKKRRMISVDAGGTDSVYSTATSYTLGANLENLYAADNNDTTLAGNNLNNTIEGNNGANLLIGGAGNDTLIGHGGADTLRGGTGDDTYYYMGNGTIIDEKIDISVKIKGKSVATQVDAGSVDTVISSVDYTLGENLENLTASNAVMNVNLTGNALANTITGNIFNNILTGGDGNDFLVGGDAEDTLYGGNGNDTLIAESSDRLYGGEGNDTFLINDISGAIIDGGAGIDIIKTSSNSCDMSDANDVENLISTAAGDLTLTGNSGANVITGGAGNDLITGFINGNGIAGDTLRGGAGNDYYIVANVGDVVDETKTVYNARTKKNVLGDAGGIDTVFIHELTPELSPYTLGANLENLAVYPHNGTTTVNLVGNSLDNFIGGNKGLNTLSGGAGNDTIFSSFTLGDGDLNIRNAVFDEDSVADILIGGSGNDTYYVGAGDTVDETTTAQVKVGKVYQTRTIDAGGVDTVITEVDFTLGHYVENLSTASNAYDIRLVGNSLANTITGGDGNDTLVGTGNDTLIGGNGDNTFEVTVAGDVIDGGGGSDTIITSVSYSLISATDVEYLKANQSLTGTAANINLTGNGDYNVLTGNAGNNILAGGGDDDRYVFSSTGGHDTIVDKLGSNTISFTSNVSDNLVFYTDAAGQLFIDYGSTTGTDLITLDADTFAHLNRVSVEGNFITKAEIDTLIQAAGAFNTGAEYVDALDVTACKSSSDYQTLLTTALE